MAMYFFVYSNKEVHKKMPPRKLMPLRGSLRSSALAGAKELAAKIRRSDTFCPDPPMPVVLGINTWGRKVKRKHPNQQVQLSDF